MWIVNSEWGETHNPLAMHKATGKVADFKKETKTVHK